MNKILTRNLNKVTKDTVYVIQKDWKDGGEKIVADVRLIVVPLLEWNVSLEANPPTYCAGKVSRK